MRTLSIRRITSHNVIIDTIVSILLLILIAGCNGGIPPSPPPSLAPLQIFEDQFNSSNTYATYTGLGGAKVVIDSGRLTVQMPDPIPTSGAGFKLELPPPKNGVGVRCLRFENLIIPEAPIGSFMKWTWYGFDNATGARIMVLETLIEKSGSFTVRHRKADGTLVTHRVENKSWSDVKTKRWDTAWFSNEVQLEIEFKDGTRYNSEWLDPPASLISGFELIATVPTFSIGMVEGSEHHWEPPKSGHLTSFDVPVLDALSSYFVGQGVAADIVMVATIIEVSAVGNPIGKDPRPRLQVKYRLDSLLKGSMKTDSFVVYHAIDRDRTEKFQPEKKLILYLQRGTDSKTDERESWFWDYGDPTGVIPFSAQNLEAAFERL